MLKSSSHRTLAVDLMKRARRQGDPAQALRRDGLPADVHATCAPRSAKKEPFVAPFVKTLAAGAKFVPASPGWGQIDSSLVLPTMFQEIVSGKKDVAAASGDAAKKMDTAFSAAG